MRGSPLRDVSGRDARRHDREQESIFDSAVRCCQVGGPVRAELRRCQGGGSAFVMNGWRV